MHNRVGRIFVCTMFYRKNYRILQLPSSLMTTVGIKQPVYCSYRNNSGMRLENKVVIVTGAGTGIGASTAYAFAKEGSKIVLADINKENVCKVANTCKEKFCANAVSFVCDVTKDDRVEALICSAAEIFGGIDVLVNNAGILTFGSLMGADIMEPYDQVMATNLRACVYLTMLATPYLVKTKGNVVNISSILGRTYSGNSKYMPYCISKAGLDHFMYGAALELQPHGVRVNNVCPGPTKTEIFEKAGVKGSWEEIGASFKLNNVSEPEEIADLIVYLASYKARSITGVRYYIDRGHLLMG